MSFDERIAVEYDLYSSDYNIRKKLPKLLASFDVLSFDTECRSVYSKEERAEATNYLKDSHTSDPLYKQARVVAESSGLSYPSLVNVTHFIFGESRSKSHVIVCTSPELEMFIWKEIAKFGGKLLVHNSLFDLKIMYERIGTLPKDFVDTALIVKSMINHVDIWKAKVGLKDIMGDHYDPKWQLMNDYEPDDLKLKSFLMYAAVDGCSTFYLHELIQEEIGENHAEEPDGTSVK